MRRNKTTKMTAVLLCAAMLLMALVSGCGGGAPSDVESAKKALLGTWYTRYENDEGEVSGSDSDEGWVFYENGTGQNKNAYGDPWYTWKLLESEESGKYTLMMAEKDAFSSQEQYVCEIQFDGNDHFILVDNYTKDQGGVDFYREPVETKNNNQ